MRLSGGDRGDNVFRLCVGAHHQPDCSHQVYMRQGVEAFLADNRTREALIYAVGEEKAPQVLSILAHAVSRPWEDVRWQNDGDLCDETMSDGRACTRLRGHEGVHQ